MKKEDIAALADITYPESIKVPLPRGEHVMVGPVSLGIIAKIETKFGSMQNMASKFKSGEMKSADLFDVIYMLIENKEDFESPEALADAVPVMVVEKLVELVYHFMEVSFPEQKVEGETSESGDKVESEDEKK